MPSRYRVERTVDVAVDGISSQRIAPDDKIPNCCRIVKFIKVVERENEGNCSELVLDSDGTVIGDRNGFLKSLEREREKKFGRIHEGLWQQLDGLSDTDPVAVSIWAILKNFPPVEVAHDPSESDGELVAPLGVVQRQAVIDDATAHVRRKIEELGASAPTFTGLPCIDVCLSITFPGYVEAN
jgi:hypothetical protein